MRPKVLAIVHAETSTGAWQPLAELGKLCHEFDTLLLVDAVTSLGCVPVALDEWGIDAAYSCSQKGLGCPPGLCARLVQRARLEAIDRRKTKVQSWYLDMTLVQKYWGQEHAYHHTAPITMIYALREGLRLILEEGLEARWARHQKNHSALKAGLLALGLPYTAVEGHQLPQLNAVRIPAGVDDVKVRQQLLNDFGIEIGSGLGDFKGKVWRIGLMGYNSRASNVLLFLAALEQCLLGQGAKDCARHRCGCGTANVRGYGLRCGLKLDHATYSINPNRPGVLGKDDSCGGKGSQRMLRGCGVGRGRHSVCRY